MAAARCGRGKIHGRIRSLRTRLLTRSASGAIGA